MGLKFKFNDDDALEILREQGEEYVLLTPDEVAELHLFLESRNEQAFKDEHERILSER